MNVNELFSSEAADDAELDPIWPEGKQPILMEFPAHQCSQLVILSCYSFSLMCAENWSVPNWICVSGHLLIHGITLHTCTYVHNLYTKSWAYFLHINNVLVMQRHIFIFWSFIDALSSCSCIDECRGCECLVEHYLHVSCGISGHFGLPLYIPTCVCSDYCWL